MGSHGLGFINFSLHNFGERSLHFFASINWRGVGNNTYLVPSLLKQLQASNEVIPVRVLLITGTGHCTSSTTAAAQGSPACLC